MNIFYANLTQWLGLSIFDPTIIENNPAYLRVYKIILDN